MTLHMLLLALFTPLPHSLLPSRDERNLARCKCTVWQPERLVILYTMGHFMQTVDIQ